jgi:hypothetical protein
MRGAFGAPGRRNAEGSKLRCDGFDHALLSQAAQARVATPPFV